MDEPFRQIRARFSAEAITVYQAFAPSIADEAVRLGRFGGHFSRSRMTWIKPSFRWMMYRSGFGSKPGQERVLAVAVSRSGFEWALRHSELSSYEPAIHEDRQTWLAASKHAPVRIQWDPERDLRGQRLDHRSIQIGLSGEAVNRYTDEWIITITDVTASAHELADLVMAGDLTQASALLPPEQPYPLPTDLAIQIGADATPA